MWFYTTDLEKLQFVQCYFHSYKFQSNLHFLAKKAIVFFVNKLEALTRFGF